MSLYVHQWGNPENPALLFLHGFMGNGRTWVPFVKELKSHYHIIAPDLPGHGESLYLKESGDYDFVETAEQVIQVLDKLKIHTSSIAGYSMGGRLAMYLAVHYPDRFNRLIVESASPGIDDAKVREERYQKDKSTADYLETADLTAFLEAWYEQPIFGDLNRHPDFSEYVASLLFNEPVELVRAMRGMSQGVQPPLEEHLKELDLPALFIAGEHDEKYSAILERLSQYHNHFELKIIPECGHSTHFQDPQTFLQLIKEFLNTGG